MKNTQFYINEIKNSQNITSDYAVSKLLKVSPQTMSKYKAGRSTLDSDTALIVAELLNISPFEILANIKASKSKKPELAKKWEQLAKQASHIAAAVILSVVVMLAGAETAIDSPFILKEISILSIMLSSVLFLLFLFKMPQSLKFSTLRPIKAPFLRRF